MCEKIDLVANTSSRTLRLLSLLQARRWWPGPLLAGELGVSARTLRRDVERLRDLGYPVDAAPGVDGGYALAPGAALPPLVVDDEEAMALAVAVQTQLAGGTDDEATLRAFTKIVQVMPKPLRRRLDAVQAVTTPALWGDEPTERVDHRVLSVLALGCRDHERVRFAYARARGVVPPHDEGVSRAPASGSQRGARGVVPPHDEGVSRAPASGSQRGARGVVPPHDGATRRVEPHRLVPLGHRWYLVAYDLDRADWRTFRVDRISDAQGTSTPFAPRTPPFDDVAAFVLAGVQGASARGDGRHHVEAVVEAPAADVRARLGGWARVVEETPTTCRFVMDTDDLAGAVFALGATGARFTVLEPPALLDQLRGWADRLAEAADAPP